MKSDKPAFPCPLEAEEYGMTLRDYFAAKALAGIRVEALGRITNNDDLRNVANQLAVGAFAIADAMLAERSK